MQITIPKPPWTGLGRKIESVIRKALYEYLMLEGQDAIAIALSGGKDSLTLLFMLHAISGRGFPPFKIHAVHVDGEFSCGSGVDADYLGAICKGLGVNFITRSSTQKRETLECYSCSRERRSLIFNAAKEAGASTIAFGHHRDDNVETLLMNLLHKGEFAGNLPKLKMYDYGVTLIRPLIYVKEQEIIEFAKLEGFIRAMCKCPVGQNSMRQKSGALLDEMENLFPNARENIAHAIRLYGSQKAANP
jgi:tRNA 2-thiocytidine biosynthesis protein TtcA